ncbi:NAD(P)-binding protein [Xylariomycetidae sp. FL0641]|nr:NAD(P)-binding protein [Xylariomycetidae sp. FL0641]
MAQAQALVLRSYSDPVDCVVESRPIPAAGPGTAVVNILAAAIGSNASYLMSHEIPGFAYPVPCVYGNNAVGRVASAGADAASLVPGRLVLVDAFVGARDDPDVMLLQGLMPGGDARSRRLASEVWRDGAAQTHAVVPLENVVPLDEAALLGTHGYEVADLARLPALAVAYGATQAARLKAGETVVVGPATGQLSGSAVEVAAALGARVVALGRNAQVLRRLKATLPRVETVTVSGDVEADARAIQAFGPVDVFLDFSPSSATEEPSHIRSAMQAVRRCGRVVFMGGLAFDIKVSYWHMVLKSLEVKGRWMYTKTELRELVKLVETGVLKIGKPAGHEVLGKFRLEDWKEALGAAAQNGGFGKMVVFTP